MNLLVIDSANLTSPYTHSLCDALIKNGCNLKLVSSKSTEFKKNYKLNLFSLIPIPKQNNFRSFTKFVKGINHLIGLLRLTIYIQKNNVDIIHFQISPLPWLDRLFIGIFKKKSIIVGTIHNTTSFHGGANFLQRLGFKSLIKNYDFYVVHTIYSMDILKKYFQIQSNKILVINHPLFNSIKKTDYKKYNDLKNGKLNILYFGTINKYKGVDTLIKAITLLDEPYLNQLKVTIAGKLLINKKNLLNSTTSKTIKSFINWELGWVDESTKKKLLFESHVIILPYYHIDGSGVLADAFEYSLPIIASDIGGFRELVINNEMGYLVNPKDPKKLSERIKKIIDNKTHLQKMSQNVNNIALKIESWDDIAKKIIGVYLSFNSKDNNYEQD